MKMQIIQTTRRWTDEEIDVIKNNYLELNDKQIGEMIGRTEGAVCSKRKQLKLHRQRNRTSTSRNSRIDFNDLKILFEERGYALLSNGEEYINESSNLRYICNQHKEKGEQVISVSHFRHGEGCYYCGRERTNASRKSKYTEEQDRQLCELKGFEYIRTEVINGEAWIYFICNKHRILGMQKMRRSNMNRDSVKGCQYCSSKNLPHWYISYVIQNSYPNIEVLSEYHGMNEPLTCYCTLHDYKFTTLAKYVYYNGRGCPHCEHIRRSSCQNLSQEEVKRRILDKNKDVEILNLDEYKNRDTHIKLKCKICSSEWEQPLSSILANSCRCPICQRDKSIGEQKISEYLLDNGIAFVPQYTFDDCKNVKELPFDFALFDGCDNLICLIEFQGEQHFKPIEYFGGQKKFELQKMRDKIKKEYCESNNIPFLAIPYWDINNVDQILDNFLKL